MDELLNILASHKVDWTNFWRKFSFGDHIATLLANPEYNIWLKKYYARCENLDKVKSRSLMQKTNPAIIARNVFLQEAIVKAQNGDYSEVNKLFRAFSNPYSEIKEFSSYYNTVPTGSDTIIVSCSS